MTTQGHLQERGVRQGCPLSPLLFIFYLNLMFFYLETKIEWNLERSIHAFVDDILFRARSIDDVQTVFEAFDGPARELGLDMNTSKTELHARRRMAQTEIRSRHGSTTATWDAAHNPRTVYKYLGVYFYTEDQGQKVLEFVKSEINFFFTNLSALNLAATELIMLCNKQLQPTIAYHLLAGPLNDSQLKAVEQCIWRNLSMFGRLPKFLSPKNRHTGKKDGSLSLIPFQIFTRTQIFNYSLRYLLGDGPRQSNYHVQTALTNKKANFVNSV